MAWPDYLKDRCASPRSKNQELTIRHSRTSENMHQSTGIVYLPKTFAPNIIAKRNNTIKMKNSTLAMEAAPAAMPVKPKMAATMAIIKNMTAYLSIK